MFYANHQNQSSGRLCALFLRRDASVLNSPEYPGCVVAELVERILRLLNSAGLDSELDGELESRLGDQVSSSAGVSGRDRVPAERLCISAAAVDVANIYRDHRKRANPIPSSHSNRGWIPGIGHASRGRKVLSNTDEVGASLDELLPDRRRQANGGSKKEHDFRVVPRVMLRYGGPKRLVLEHAIHLIWPRSAPVYSAQAALYGPLEQKIICGWKSAVLHPLPLRSMQTGS